MISTNKKIALRIGIISTIFLIINSYLINYVLKKSTYIHQLIIISFIVVSFFVIIYSITYYFILPLNDVVNILKEIRKSSRNVITKINNPIWNDVDKELNKLISKNYTDSK